MKNRTKGKIASWTINAAFFFSLGVAGGLESMMISPGRAVAYLLIGLLVMVFAGKKGGLA